MKGAPVASIELQQGTIHYEEVGPPTGRPVVCVHGFVMAGDLWAQLAGRLADAGLRVIMPTWPLGAHREPMRPGVEVTPRAVVGIIGAFLDALDLHDVVLIGNDTGGALCQSVAVHHPERLGALVLTSCDAFDNFPPAAFKPLVAAAKVPGALRAAMLPMRSAAVRRSPLAFGSLSHGDVDELAREWVKPALESRDVFEDLREFTAGMHKELTLEAAERLGGFDKPALLAWAADDAFFPVEHAHRLAAILPQARVEVIERSRTFSMIDQPERLADLVKRTALGQAHALEA
jgi:pimeloyl-ACP methyl ester carboxylesterase